MLRETLASVLAQGWPSLEVILSDNGSDPETVRVVDALRNPRLRYRRNAATVPMAITTSTSAWPRRAATTSSSSPTTT